LFFTNMIIQLTSNYHPQRTATTLIRIFCHAFLILGAFIYQPLNNHSFWPQRINHTSIGKKHMPFNKTSDILQHTGNIFLTKICNQYGLFV